MAKIYLISPSQIDDIKAFVYHLEEIMSLPEKPSFFQLRLKNCTIAHIEDCIKKIMPICNKYNVNFVINDSILLALKYNIGVHVGCDDASIQDCKNFKAHSNKHMGVSCYNSIARAKQFEDVADCISFGAMFQTRTKKDTQICNPSIIKEYAQHNPEKEIAIIGGINAENINTIANILPLVSYVCVVSSVW